MSDRTVYIVAYDICDPKRLRAVYKTMRGFGDHWQYSVFRCELTAAQKVMMITKLSGIMNDSEDQVLIAPLGPPAGHNARSVETLGLPLPRTERVAFIV